MTELLRRCGVSVSNRGELVILTIGSSTWSLDFALALDISAMMRREARYAKAAAGDTARRWNVTSILSDATAEKKRPERYRRLPDRLKAKDISVKAVGQIVNLRIERATKGIPYSAAATISQWLRLHGKVARNAAGEKAHWSKLVKPELLEQRA